ncbi:MAG TPA: hypothetical protein VM299_05060 [Solirubrobacteraceae bacterium]|jgi:chromosome segregation ATPase|nr:hypothetical protein [Solirubrobacteraceae bacterium]
MSDHDSDSEGLRERLAKQGEDTLGKMAEDLLANPLVSGAIGRAFEARERAAAVQEATLAALNIPSAADIERLTRRVRSVSQRLEGIEDGIDRVDDRLSGLAASAGLEPRLEAIDAQLAELTRQLAALRAELPGATEPVPARQERLKVSS